jgi:2-C-methyl-D-erythritol 2,4-cyclodiphosphate synthase
MFPDTDKQWYMADSIELLKLAYKAVSGHGYEIGNADITIVLQSPRISPYIDRMRDCLAAALGTDIANISVKATTEEKLGFTGAGEGIAATAAVLLKKTAQP